MSEKTETTINSRFSDISGAKQVYGWILGRLNRYEKISTMTFGQFTTSVIPPKAGWIYCGKNIPSNFVTHLKVTPFSFESSMGMI
jgi:hypothetical protein